jgi:hypothetical protein
LRQIKLGAMFDNMTSRADEILAERLGREQQQLERERRRAEAEARELALEHAERRRQVAEAFDDSFQAFGVETPQPLADEHPSAFRRRLFEQLRRRLPSNHALADVRGDELPTGKTYLNFEKQMIEAAKAEGMNPSFDNLPRDSSLVPRTRVDRETGEKSTSWLVAKVSSERLGARREGC